jgi:hypothetical protein
MSPEPSEFDDFYIGYEALMPAGFVRRVRASVAAVLTIAVLAPLVLIASQRRFASGVFEYGPTRTLEGRVVELPYPAHAVDGAGPAA